MKTPPEQLREAHANRVQASINCDTLQESLRLAESEFTQFDDEMNAARIALVVWALDGADSDEGLAHDHDVKGDCVSCEISRDAVQQIGVDDD